MMEGTLFERSRDDRFSAIDKMLRQDLAYREQMLRTHPDKVDYWGKLIEQAQDAVDDLNVLWGESTRDPNDAYHERKEEPELFEPGYVKREDT